MAEVVEMATWIAVISCQAGHLVVIWASGVAEVGWKPSQELVQMHRRCP